MNRNRNLILLLVLSLLSAWYYFYEIRGKANRTAEQIESSRFFPELDPADITRISIQRIATVPDDIDLDDTQRSTYRLGFVKSDTTWHLDSPVKADGNTNAIENLAATLAHLQRGRLISDDPDSLASFGLDSPGFIIDLAFSGETRQLRLGDENPSKDSFYALLDSDRKVYLVSTDIKQSLMRKAIDYRNRLLLNASRDAIAQINLVFPEENVNMDFLRENGDWTVRHGEDSPGDVTRIEEIAGAITAHQIQDFIDSPSAASAYGLENPFIRIIVTLDDDTAHQIDIGSLADDGGKMRFARLNDTGPVCIIGREFFELFKADFFHYRSKNICDMNRDVINRIVIEKSNETIELTRRESGDWMMIRPSGFAIDSTIAGSYLSDLTYMRATGIKPEQEPFGTIQATIHLYGASDSNDPLTVLEIGEAPSDGVGKWVKTSDDSTIFRVSDSDIERLIPKAFHFRDKKMVSFERENVVRIEIEKAGEKRIIEPEGNTWKFTGNQSAVTAGLSPDEIVWSLYRLQMSDIAEEFDLLPEPSRLTRYGLDLPRSKIIISLKQGEKQELHLGNSLNAQQMFARCPYDPYVAIIDASRFEWL